MTDEELDLLNDAMERIYSLFSEIRKEGIFEIESGVRICTKKEMQKDQTYWDEGTHPASFEKAKWWVVWPEGPTKGFNEFFQAVQAALGEADEL